MRFTRINVDEGGHQFIQNVEDAYVWWGEAPGSEAFNLLVREVVREMTVKSGQKCTAIRRILVPADVYDAAAEAIGAKLAGITVGNPRNDSVRMGSLVSWAQLDSVREGLATLLAHTQVLHDGRNQPLVDADPAVAACMARSRSCTSLSGSSQKGCPVAGSNTASHRSPSGATSRPLMWFRMRGANCM